MEDDSAIVLERLRLRLRTRERERALFLSENDELIAALENIQRKASLLNQLLGAGDRAVAVSTVAHLLTRRIVPLARNLASEYRVQRILAVPFGACRDFVMNAINAQLNPLRNAGVRSEADQHAAEFLWSHLAGTWDRALEEHLDSPFRLYQRYAIAGIRLLAERNPSSFVDAALLAATKMDRKDAVDSISGQIAMAYQYRDEGHHDHNVRIVELKRILQRHRLYFVRHGDSLTRIAQVELGDRCQWLRIYDLNQAVVGDDPDELRPGKELIIPPRH